MANRKIIDNGLGAIGQFPPLTLTSDKLTEQQAAWLSSAINAVTVAINGQLSFGNTDHATRAGNFFGQWIQQYFRDANVEVEIPHGLGRAPYDVWIGLPNAPCRFYSNKRGSWSASTFWMACDTAGVTVPILVF